MKPVITDIEEDYKKETQKASENIIESYLKRGALSTMSFFLSKYFCPFCMKYEFCSRNCPYGVLKGQCGSGGSSWIRCNRSLHDALDEIKSSPLSRIRLWRFLGKRMQDLPFSDINDFMNWKREILMKVGKIAGISTSELEGYW